MANHCLRSTNYINVIVCDKQKHLQYMNMDEAIAHCTKGISIWRKASNDEGVEPDVVMASAGDIPTKESLAAVVMLREYFPDLKIRFVNVVDLFKLTPDHEHPHGLSDRDFDSLFTTDRPIIFNFHGYPWLIHRLTYSRTNHRNLHVRGYKEKGNINTPLDLAIQNQIDRFSLAMDVIDRVPSLRVAARTRRRSCATCRSSVSTTPTSTAWTSRRSTSGSGRNRGKTNRSLRTRAETPAACAGAWCSSTARRVYAGGPQARWLAARTGAEAQRRPGSG